MQREAADLRKMSEEALEMKHAEAEQLTALEVAKKLLFKGETIVEQVWFESLGCAFAANTLAPDSRCS